MAKRITADEFAERVSNFTNGRISIVKDTFTGTHNRVTAYCNIHKVYFEVCEAKTLCRSDKIRPNCPKCTEEHLKLLGKNRIKPWEEVYESFIKLYKNKYSYDKTTYSGRRSKMKVHCNDCGTDFEITPDHHLKYNNGGCPKCHLTKNAKCSKCGKEIIIDRHLSERNVLCDECKKEKKKYNKRPINDKQTPHYVKCKFCGEIHKVGEKCQNRVCNKFKYLESLRILIPFGFDWSKIGTADFLEEFNKASELLLTEYFDNKLSGREIFEKYDCKQYITSEWYIRNFIKNKLDRKLRTVGDSIINAIETGNRLVSYDVKHFKTENHKTWEDKEITLRSSYEIEFSNMLDEQRISYDYENMRIRYFDTQRNKERVAVPDFYLIDSNTIVEVKSSWTLNKQNMIDRRKAYLELGYNFKLWYEHQFVNLDEIEEQECNIETMRENKKK